jgi:predicted PhzF superfamily epimerase YddE/YHI9
LRVELPLIQIDAFAERLFEGNPAAVMPLTEWPDDALLQQLAAENNLSETAFTVPLPPAQAGADDATADADVPAYRLRWFTPATEVDLCGHATLAAAGYLLEDHHPDAAAVRFITRSGWLRVERLAPRTLAMDFPGEVPRRCPVDPAVVAALGVPVLETFRATDLICRVESAEQVRRLRPDLRTLAGLPVRGVMVTAVGEPGSGYDFVSRWFGPQSGVDEDPVTGSAHSQAAPLWAERLGRTDLVARQLSPRGGTVGCRVAGDRVILQGSYRRYLTGTVTLP